MICSRLGSRSADPALVDAAYALGATRGAAAAAITGHRRLGRGPGMVRGPAPRPWASRAWWSRVLRPATWRPARLAEGQAPRHRRRDRRRRPRPDRPARGRHRRPLQRRRVHDGRKHRAADRGPVGRAPRAAAPGRDGSSVAGRDHFVPLGRQRLGEAADEGVPDGRRRGARRRRHAGRPMAPRTPLRPPASRPAGGRRPRTPAGTRLTDPPRLEAPPAPAPTTRSRCSSRCSPPW